MSQSAGNLTASQAAARLGVSIKALRLYEGHGLIAPGRTRVRTAPPTRGSRLAPS